MSEAMREMTLDEYVGKLGHHLANRELIALRAELAELRARAEPVLDSPATVGAGTFAAGLPWRMVIEAAKRQHQYRNESPAAVPHDVAKDAERLDWLVSEVALVQSLAISPPHGDGTTRYHIVWPEYGEDQRDTYATPREAIDAAILAADTEGRKDE